MDRGWIEREEMIVLMSYVNGKQRKKIQFVMLREELGGRERKLCR